MTRARQPHLILEEQALQGGAQVLREAHIAAERVAVDGVRVHWPVHACTQETHWLDVISAEIKHSLYCRHACISSVCIIACMSDILSIRYTT